MVTKLDEIPQLAQMESVWIHSLQQSDKAICPIGIFHEGTSSDAEIHDLTLILTMRFG